MKNLLLALLLLPILCLGQNTGDVRTSYWNGTTWVSLTLSGTGVFGMSGASPFVMTSGTGENQYTTGADFTASIQSSPRSAGWMASYFKTASENLFVAVSNDGITWSEQPANYDPPIPGVRDPSIVYWNGAFWSAYTINAFSGTEDSFAIATSIDGVNWEHVRDVDLSAIPGGPEYVLAPEFRQIDGKIICLVSVSVDDATSFQTFLIQDWSPDFSSNGAPQELDGLPANVIDATVIKQNNTYYLFFKNEAIGIKTIEAATASQLEGPYTVQETGDWAGWGTSIEGPNVVQLSNGKYRIYFDDYDTFTMYYSDSDTTDLLGTWGARAVIDGITARHICVINIPLGMPRVDAWWDAILAEGIGVEQQIASSTTPTWDLSLGSQAAFTATNNTTFTISNLSAGNTGTLVIRQSSGGSGFTITFPAGTKQAFGGGNTYTMSGNNVIDILYFRQSGTRTIIEGVVPSITP